MIMCVPNLVGDFSFAAREFSKLGCPDILVFLCFFCFCFFSFSIRRPLVVWLRIILNLQDLASTWLIKEKPTRG